MRKFLAILLVFVLVFVFIGCTKPKEAEKPSEPEKETPSKEPEKTPEETEKEPEGVSFEAGKYIGKAQGHNGEVEVEVEFSDKAIVAISVVNSGETEHVARVVYDELPKVMIEHQTLNVDAVTGATVTSGAFKSAVKDAVVQAKGNPDLLNAEVPKGDVPETLELEADVVVVGGGSSGASAALSAEQKGLSVILVEKNAMLGGHTAFSGGLTLITGAKIQEELGVTDDTPEKAFEDLFVNGGEKSDPALLKLYTENMGVSTDWSIDYVGAKAPEKITRLGENAVDRGLFYVGGGAGLMEAYEKKLAETSVQVHLDTKATGLLTEGDKVVGIEAVDKAGTKYTIKAKSTVLAAGGYAARKDLLPESVKSFVYYGAALSTGDGIEMAQAIGADTIHMGYLEMFENGVEWLPGIAKSTYNGSMAAWNVSGILVDRSGNRVVNERGSGTSIVQKQEEQPDGILFLLMDQATFDTFRENIGGTGISQGMLDQWLENNGTKGPIFAHGKTLEEVAGIAGVDPEGLKASVEKYNEYVEAGEDAEFGRPADYMTAPIGEGPYYLVEQRPRYATTLGGLLVNTDLQVINKDGEAIEGLYAVGDTAGGVRGDDSVPGSDVGWAITSGYLIGDILTK